MQPLRIRKVNETKEDYAWFTLITLNSAPLPTRNGECGIGMAIFGRRRSTALPKEIIGKLRGLCGDFHPNWPTVLLATPAGADAFIAAGLAGARDGVGYRCSSGLIPSRHGN